MQIDVVAPLLGLGLLFLIRDALLLAHRRLLVIALPLVTFLLSGEIADRLAPAEALRLLNRPSIWAPALLVHLLLGLWLLRSKSIPLLAVSTGPLFLVFAMAVNFVLLQSTPVPTGLLAGALAAAGYLAATLLLSRLRSVSLAKGREFAAGSHLSALLLIPFNGFNMNSIHDLLYILSSAFLLPTLLGTLAAFAYGAWVLGRFLSDLADHRRNAIALASLLKNEPTQDRFLALSLRADWQTLQLAIRQHAAFPAMVDKTVADLEHAMHGRVERLGIMSKVGPMLGLIGTLIPLQPALAGLAKGDMQAMAANLQIGFTTTVLGLLVGGTCYAVSVIMRGWYQQDVTDMHFLLALWQPTEATPSWVPDLAAVRMESR